MNYLSDRNQIWLITYNFGEVKAGPVIRFLRYEPAFRKMGYQLIFITKQRGSNHGYRKSDDGIISYHIPCKTLTELTREALKMVRACVVPPCCLLFLSLHYQNFFDLKKVIKTGIKCVYISTMQLSILVNQSSGKNRSWIRMLILRQVLKKLYSQMHVIVSSTIELSQDFTQLGIPESKLKIIFNGVDTDRFFPASVAHKTTQRNELLLPQRVYILLYVGLFIERKGVDNLLLTISELRKRRDDFKLLMVGNEKDIHENSDEFNTRWPILKMEALKQEWLIVHPFSPDIERYYKASDIFIFMSKLEGMPNVLLEAMSSGIVVATTRFNGFSDEYGISGQNYMEIPNNCISAADSLDRLLNDNELRKRISEGGRELAIEKFNIDQSIKNYTLIFQSSCVVSKE